MSHHILTRKPLQALLKDLLGVAAGLGAAAPLAVLANPTGGHVVGGSATISTPSANSTVVHQNTASAVINWQQFSIGSGQYVQFIQPSSSSVALNRVTGGNASLILGDITANGQVFLVNPFGIMFGKGSVIDAQGFVASTLDISNSDFMHGRYSFFHDSGAPEANVVNQGLITSAKGGYVVLQGDYVENDGVIDAQSGRVVLAADGGARLTLGDDDLISYSVDKATLAQLAGVDNVGQVTADGGAVLMTADVANALTATAVNNSGLVTAHSIVNQNGVIVLSAKGGDIDNSGTLDASATQAGVRGGDVVVHGDGRTQLATTSVIHTEGDKAKGGFIELSGHTLGIRGVLGVGRGGNLLIDPTTLLITTGNRAPTGGNTLASVGTTFIDNLLNSNVNVTLVASNNIHARGNVHNITATGTGNLTIKTGTLALGAGSLGPGTFNCASAGVCKAGTAVVFTPTSGTINLNGNGIFPSGSGIVAINIKGAFTADASKGSVNITNVTAPKGITVRGHVITTGALSASNGAVVVTGNGSAPPGNGITVNGNVKGKSVTITENLPSAATYGGAIHVTGSIDATAGSISVSAVTTGPQSMNLIVHNLTASKKIVLSQEGHRGRMSFGSVTAGSGGSTTHIGLKASTVLTGPSASGGNISGGKITATGGVQISTNVTGAGGRGGSANMSSITAKYISINALAPSGAKVTTRALDAVGTAANNNVSITADANGGPTFAGGNIKVNSGGITVAHGGVTLNAHGGSDSGGKINISGGISAAGLVNILAVNTGCCSGSVNITSGGVTGKFINIATRVTAASNHTGARITIHGNVKATGTAPPSSSNQGVILAAGSSGDQNGGGLIQVTGNITASHGVVDLTVWGINGGRSITAGHASGGAWANGNIKARRVDVSVNGAGVSGSIDVGGVTTLGVGSLGNASFFAQGNGSGHIGIHGNVQVSGNEARIVNDGTNITVTGSITVTGANGEATIDDPNSGGGLGRASINVGNITVPGRVFIEARGHGGSPIKVVTGNVTGSNLTITASNQSGGNGAVSVGKLKAPVISLFAQGNAASGHAGHVTIGSINAVNATSTASVKVNAYGKADTITVGNVTVSGHGFSSVSIETGHHPHPIGALLKIETHGGSSDAIAINGNINVMALASANHAFGDAVVEIAGFAGSALAAPVSKVRASITGGISISAARDAHVLVHGSAGGALAVKAGRNVDDTLPSSEGGLSGALPNLVMKASAVALQAGTNINLSNASLTVGSGAAPGVAGDHPVTTLFGLGSIAPNAAFTATGTVDLGMLAGTAKYLLIGAGTLTFGSVALASGALVQFTAPADTDTIGVGNGAGQFQYSTADINAFSADHVVIGNTGLTGTMTVGTTNLGTTTTITLVDDGAIKSSGLLTAGHLNILAGAGSVALMANVPGTTIVSGANVSVNDAAFKGSGTLTIAGTGVGSVSYSFGGNAALGSNVKLAGALTLKAAGALNLSSAHIQAGKSVVLDAATINLGKAAVTAGGAFSASAQGSAGILTAGGGTITASGITLKSGGFISMNGETLQVTGGGALTVSAGGSVGLSGAAINAGTFTAKAQGSLDLTSASVKATQAVTLDATKHILLGKANIAAGGTFSASAHGSISNGGSAGSIKATSATLKTLTGNIVLNGTRLSVGTGAATLSAAGNISMTGANVHAGSLTALAGGNIDLSGVTASASKQVQLVAGFQGVGNPLALKNITLTGVTITTKVFAAAAGGSILDASTAGVITANGMFMSAVHGNIAMGNTQLNIGSGSVSGAVGDSSAAAILTLAGLLHGGLKPNGTLVAGGGAIELGGLAFTGNYLYLQADNIGILGPVTTIPGAVIQLTPFTLTNSMGIENTTANGDNTNFLNQGLLSLFGGDTLVIGRAGASGNVDLGTKGPFTLAAGTNLIIDTSGTVTGLSTVTSTGLVTTLDALFAATSFPPPTGGEIDPSTSPQQQKKQELIEFIESGGQTGGTITEDTGTASVCH